MRLKLFRAASTSEAMAQVRAALGPEALILSTRRVADGVEVTAALDQPEEPEAAAAGAGLQPDFVYHGIPAAIAIRLSGAELVESLGRVLRFGELPLAEGPAPRIIFCGVPGAGKTLSVARLATRMVMAGKTPVVITADGRRAGAAEELAAYTRVLGLSLVVASTPGTLQRALAQHGQNASVLIDTPGINPFSAVEAENISALAQASGAAQVLVMPAGFDPAEAADQACAFAALGAHHLVVTRLDMSRRLGSLFAACTAASMILTEAGIGPGAIDSLPALTPAFLAQRLREPLSPLPAPEQRVPEQRVPEQRVPELRVPELRVPAPRAVEVSPADPPARPAYTRPSFPSARSVAAKTWNSEWRGDDGYKN